MAGADGTEAPARQQAALRRRGNAGALPQATNRGTPRYAFAEATTEPASPQTLAAPPAAIMRSGALPQTTQRGEARYAFGEGAVGGATTAPVQPEAPAQ